MDIIYEHLILKATTPVYNIINIQKQKDDKLGLIYSVKLVEITDDKRINFPIFMIMIINPNSLAEKNTIRLGSQIIQINDIDVTLENYDKLIQNENLKLKVNTSYCMIYQLLLREGVRFNYDYLDDK